MVNRGAIAEKAFIRSGLAKGFVADQLNIDRRTLTSRLQRPDLDYDFILELYKVLRIDVTEDFPELGKFVLNAEGPGGASEEQEEKPALDACKEEVEMWKRRHEESEKKYVKLLEEYNRKYTHLLEEYNLVLKENKDLQRERK